jgi:hypothetical protein
MLAGRGQLGLLLVVLALVGGCALSGPPPDAFAVGEMRTVTGTSPRPSSRAVFDPAERVIRLHAPANGTAAFQLVADAGNVGLRDVRVTCSPLTAPGGRTLSADAVSAFRMLPVRVTNYPAWYLRRAAAPPEPRDVYDVLVPAGRHGWDAPPGARLAAWVDLRVPRDARPGRYRGTLTLAAAGREPWEAQIELEVYDVVLPSARALPAVGGFDVRDVFRHVVRRNGEPYVPPRLNRRDEIVRRGLVAIREMMRLARRHHLDLFDKGIHPVLKRDAMGRIRLDWDDYDAIVGPYVRGSAFDDGEPCALWPLPFHADWPPPAHYGGADTYQYTRTARETAAAVAEHLGELNAGGQWVVWPWRGAVGPEGFRRHAALARAARSALPRTPVLCTLPPNPPQATGWRPPGGFAALADLVAPPGHWLDPAAARTDADAPAGTWVSPGRPPYAPGLHVAAPAADARALPWVAMRYNARGLLLPEVLDWSHDPGDTSPGERLFHPGPGYGADGVLPSARLKRLRRGLEDAALCDLLRQRGREGIAEALANTLVHYAGLSAAGDHYLDPRLGGWADDAATWHRAGRLLAEEVRVAVHAREATDDDLVRQRVAWRVLLAQTRSVRVERVTSCVTDGGDTPLRAELSVELQNPLAQPVSASLEEVELPDGWTPAGNPGAAVELAPGGSGRLHLPLAGEIVRPTATGKLPVTLTLKLADATRGVRTAVPLLVAAEAPRPPRIDGRLDDWPLGRGNVAGAFRLVGRRGRIGDGLARRQTTAFVLRDREALYFAFRCEEPNPDGLVVRTDNRVRYEQLLPVGEDLVEILLDPGADAVRPEDLYHIAIKANGVVRCERGVSTSPPLGEARPWAVEAAAAVGRRSDHWVVELAVPLSAFGDDAGETWWGLNFVRFAVQGGEVSSWTGEPRCFYTPRTLGTMLAAPDRID